MVREQSIIKVAGSEIPLLALDDWKFWLLIILGCVMIFIWKNGKSKH